MTIRKPKERPIRFNGDMVCAILKERKTQTRRVVKPQLANGWRLDKPPRLGFITSSHPKKGRFGVFIHRHADFTERDLVPCPYGQPGDQLWVRETTQENCVGSVSLSRYSADGAPVLYTGCEDPEFNGSVAHWDYSRAVRPSIHMPRWASRIQLEITDVRVERLQEISEADALAEGITPYKCGFTNGLMGPFSHPVLAFSDLWKSISGTGSWDQNPWVWVVEFRVARS